MKINQRMCSTLLTAAAALLTCFSLASASSSGSDIKNKSGKKSEASKEEKANTKLPPCGACTNLVASFDQVKITGHVDPLWIPNSDDSNISKNSYVNMIPHALRTRNL